ncbi:MAG: DUF433 domain-containing protein [Planctomycetota bacterium]
MNWRDWIHQDPAIMVGKPVFRGTRLKVETVLRELGHGTDRAEILRLFPSCKSEYIEAALLFTADLIARKDEQFVQAAESNRLREEAV